MGEVNWCELRGKPFARGGLRLRHWIRYMTKKTRRSEATPFPDQKKCVSGAVSSGAAEDVRRRDSGIKTTVWLGRARRLRDFSTGSESLKLMVVGRGPGEGTNL